MIFVVNKDPFGAVQLQKQLKDTNNELVEVYLSPEETEQNLYKTPEVILLEENLGFGDLLYLTQSIKAYDSSIKIVWLCEENSEVKKLYNSYGVMRCLTKGDYFLERLSLSIIEARETLNRSKNKQKQIDHLRRITIDAASEA